ncbi:TIGR04282 family arsenosugar biosynthesis glycosyltransferase [Robiginitalea sp. SC105]|uniref:TIGR04282 family arsenosugar biosynthesis glycosyltransferase n=1 Tax=Robiginitalea sp. SC105 TaxID=2762332 RepID=UPI0016398B5B|nr:TIGR04282 family arsenosugar biosynthesis glycosyltransferase [Robiginitalea sp. SC105]
MSRTSEQALLIFTRNPEPGKCKTRLAATIGDRAALAIYTFLLRHTAALAAVVPDTDKFVYFSDYLGDGSLWDPAVFRPRLQEGPDLGVRMERAFDAAFREGYQRVVLIGSDLYDLSSADLAIAFKSLKKHPAVIGPATDGGYYLIGLTAPVPGLFRDKAWGTDTVCSDTLADLEGMEPALLPPRNDVDYYEDIAGIPAFEPFLKDIGTDDDKRTR